MLKDIFKYFLYIGFAGFGGPLAIIEMMRKDLVVKKKWIKPDEFESILGYVQIAPGPYSYQVAMYIAFRKGGYIGSLIAAFLIIFPSFLFVLIFSVFYSEYKDVTYVIYSLYGISPVIAALIFQSGFSLGKSIFKKDLFQYLIFFLSLGLTIFFRIHIIYIIISSAAVALLYYSVTNKKKLFSIALTAFIPFFLQIRENVAIKLEEVGLLFLKVGALTYGSGYVIVGVLRQEVVERLHWLNAQEFIDGLVIGQITPGPVIITSTFIGYLTNGFMGAAVATFFILFPSTIIVLMLVKNIDRIRNNFYVKALIKGANAAAIGAILATAYFISRDAIVDIYTLCFFLSGLAVLILTDIKPIFILGAFAILGIVAKLMVPF